MTPAPVKAGAIRMARSRINLTRSKLLLLRNECKNRGIEPARDKSYAGWPPEAVALLGAVPDSLLAAILDVAQSSVRKGRVALDIPSCLEQGRPRLPLTPEARRLLDRERIKRGAPVRTETYSDWEPELVSVLGVLPDRAIARITGLDVSSVNKGRHTLGIAPWRVRRPPSPLTPDEARRLYDSGLTQQAIARMHDIDQPRVSRLLRKSR